MPSENMVRCSQCGDDKSVDSRFAACVADTIYDKLPEESGDLSFECKTITEVTTNDDIRVWRIPLCRACLPKSYRVYLRDNSKKLATGFWVSTALLLPLGLFGIFTQIAVGNPVVACFVVIGLLGGIIGFLCFGILWLVNFKRFKKLERSGYVPARQIDKCFVGEGLRIIRALQTTGTKSVATVVGDFPLPKHTSLDEIDMKPEQKKKFVVREKKWNIIAIASTEETLRKSLSDGWRQKLDHQAAV